MIHPADCLRYLSVFFLNCFYFFKLNILLARIDSSLMCAFLTLRKSIHLQQTFENSEKAPYIDG